MRARSVSERAIVGAISALVILLAIGQGFVRHSYGEFAIETPLPPSSR